MTSEIYVCYKCKEQREYLYDQDGVVCKFIPCQCGLRGNTNHKAIVMTDKKIKAIDKKVVKTMSQLDKALNQIGKTIGEKK